MTPEETIQLPPTARALANIDTAALLRTIDDWVRIPSLSGTAAENTAQTAVAQTMRQLGLTVETWHFTDDELRHHPAFCTEFERTKSLGVVGRMGGLPTAQPDETIELPALILNGHVDVVPVGDENQWHFPPWQATLDEATGRIYGRGTLDMKANLACALYAAKAISDAGLTLQRELLIQSVIGEEDGGLGTLAAIEKGYRANAAIVLEPTNLTIVPAHAGALNFRLTIPGQPAHGAIRHEGVDPLEKFMLLYQALLTLEKSRNLNVTHPMFADYNCPYPICVGKIQGGTWASTVAENVVIEGRFGVAIEESPAQAKQILENVVRATAEADPWLRAHPPTLEWWGGQFAPAAIRTNHPIIKTVARQYEEITGDAPILRGLTAGTDMRLLINQANIPTILFGAGDLRKAHQFDEYVPLAELKTLTQTLVLTILDFCGYTERLAAPPREPLP